MSEQVPLPDGSQPHEADAPEGAGAAPEPPEWTPDPLKDVGDLQGYYPYDPPPLGSGPTAPPVTGSTPPPAAGGPGWGLPGQQPPTDWGGPKPPPPPPTQPQAAGWVPNPSAAHLYPQAAQPGVVPLRPLRLGEIIEGTFRTFRRYPAAVFSLGVSLAFLQSLSYISLFWILDRSHFLDHWNALNPATPNEWPTTWSGYSDLSPVWFLWWFVFATFITWLTYTIGSLAFAHIGGEAVLGAPVSAGDAWRLTRRQFGRSSGVWLVILVALMGLWVVGYAFMLFVIAVMHAIGVLVAFVTLFVLIAVELFVWVRLCLAPIALALEDRGPKTAITRGVTLSRGSGWRVLGYSIVAFLIAGALSVVVALPFNLIGSIASATSVTTTANSISIASLSPFGLFMQLLGNLVATAVWLPFLFIFATMFYTDLRMRNENLGSVLNAAASQRKA